LTNPLYDMLIGRHSDSNAPLLHLTDETIVTYSDMTRRVVLISGMLRKKGLQKGDRLAIQCEKSPEALALYLACVHSGVIFVPLNTAYTPDEIAYFIIDATPKILVIDPKAEDLLRPVSDRANTILLTLSLENAGSFTDAVSQASPTTDAINCKTDDLACFLYTSGTTGRSKGAMLTQANLMSNAQTLTATWHVSHNDVLLHALPIFHAHGLFVACNVLMNARGSMIWLPGFSVDQVNEALPRATTMMGVPTFYTRLLNSTGFTKDAVRHIRLFTSGSAPLLAETHVQFNARTGHAILERYGMTETGMNTSNPFDAERRAGTVGFPLEGVELRITTENGTPLPKGEIGMIEVRGANVFKGYWNMPRKTAEELRGDGFFITGDMGKIDKDGYVIIIGREKDLIISGGYNIYPKEVELLLDEEPTVKESAVIGLPHSDFGEGVVAVLVPENNSVPDLERIKSNLAVRLANFKRPKQYIVVNALPRNTMGKVQKNILREHYQAVFATDDPEPNSAGK
jgi:malonyl-CoA/methylmalonyl-CoA synthetase